MSITTLRAFDVTETSARLTGQLTSLGSANEVVVSFLWKPATGPSTHETSGQVRDSQGYVSSILSGLTPGTTYYYRAKAEGDADTVYGEERSFTTTDNVAPIISLVNCDTTASVATVTWITNEAATSRIDYGLTEDYIWSTGWSADLVTSHTVSLTDLSANSTYHYRITCRDASGNETTLADSTFTTEGYYGGMATTPWKIIGFAVVGLVAAAFSFIWVKTKERTERATGTPSGE
jgi:phosphodiesterase/alkaline phosphatase D-like protein